MSQIESEQPARGARDPLATSNGMAIRVVQAGSDVLLFAVASAVAALAAYGVWTQLPQGLRASTDIVGYPIYANFNIYRYFWFYWLVIGFVPLVTLALFLLLRRVIPRSGPPSPPRPRTPAEEATPPPSSRNEIATVGIARVLFVGALFGLEAAIALSQTSKWVLTVGLPVLAGYALLASVAALGLGRTGRLRATYWERLALVNAVAVPFCIAAMYAVSRATELKVAVSGEVREYSWLPLWLAAGLTAVALAWTVRSAINTRAASQLRGLERRLLLVVAGPIVVYLFVALLPGAWSGVDMFHEGELLAGARLIEAGAFPWRDLIFIHGLLTDAGFQLVGFNLFEESRWGYVAGTLVVVLPLYGVSFYYLFAYLFHRNWLFLVGTQLAMILGVVFEGQLRFIFLPLALVLLGMLLSKASRVRAALFMTVVVAQTVVTPEAGIAALAMLLTIVTFDAYYYDRSRRLRENFRRTILCAAAGALLTAAWAIFLLAFRALDDFVFAYVTFASDHQLTGGLPVSWVSDRYRFAAVAPVVLVLLAFWYFAVQILRRASLTIADWVMGALALFVALYYHKFLARADDHVFQPYAITIPLLYYALYRLIGVAADGLGRIAARVKAGLPIRLAITAVAVVVLILQAPLTIPDVVRDVPGRLDASVPEEARNSTVGFISPEGLYDPILGDVDTVLHAYLEPGDKIFDFSNNPALFHYFLERQPATRYYHVSMAIRAETQDDLVDELEDARPKLVVFSSGGLGLPSWDGISNQVRHYNVSRYLLDHYRPLLHQEGFMFMARNDAALDPAALPGADTNDLLFRTYPCDWGYAPNFLTAQPSGESAARPVSLTRHELGRLLTVNGWAVDPSARGPASTVVAAIGGRVVAQVVPSVHRPDIVGFQGDEAFLASGFTLVVPPEAATGNSLQEVRIYALSQSGAASELGRSADPAWGNEPPPAPTELQLDGRRVPVTPGAVEGFIDSSSVAAQVVALDLPPGGRARAYDWLEIETRSPLQVNGFMLSDAATKPERGIFFRTLERDETKVRVLVGACSQWHGYPSRRLYLREDLSQPIAAVRLYR